MRKSSRVTIALLYITCTLGHTQALASPISNNPYINAWAQGGPAKVKQKKRLEKKKVRVANKKRQLKDNIVHDKIVKQENKIHKMQRDRMLPVAILEALDDQVMTQEEVFYRAKRFIKDADNQVDPNGYRRAGILLEVLESSPPSEGYSQGQVSEYLGYCVMKEAKDIQGYALAKKLAEAAAEEGQNEPWLFTMLWSLNSKLYQLTHEYQYQEGMTKYQRYAVN